MQGDARDVYGDGNNGAPLADPLAQHLQHLFVNIAVQAIDESVHLKERNKSRGGAVGIGRRVIPADERLCAVQPPGMQIHLRLIEHDELAVFHTALHRQIHVGFHHVLVEERLGIEAVCLPKFAPRRAGSCTGGFFKEFFGCFVFRALQQHNPELQ